ncbi:Serine--tRNA ligase [Colletotrichum trifolii]|uniref:serine--tRNA ligase n=1 Tax=Colletotrichum trifolii TaxID=5466 RepID=A0A4R8PZV3_COLTR|nr:Serine--tRNA ligase [Colletotrichum trifolii]
MRLGFAGEPTPKAVLSLGPELQRRVGDFRDWDPEQQDNWRRRPTRKAWGEDHELWQYDVRSLDLGLVEDKIDRAIREALTKFLLIDSRPRRTALVLSSSVPLPLVSAALDVLFHRYQAPTVSLLSAAVMSTLGAGMRSALVVDLGWAETVVTSVYEYREMRTSRTVRGGKMLVDKVHDFIQGRLSMLPTHAPDVDRDKKQNQHSNEARLAEEMETLALSIPNLTSQETPVGDEPELLSYINEHPLEPVSPSDQVWRSHVHIGSELGILDFAAGGITSGWGWYYLLDEAAQLEQALIQYALAVSTRHGWRQAAPPSVVYSHMASACGFQPRDQNGEQQIYTLTQSLEDAERGRPELCLAGTSEIPLAGMKAGATLDANELPLKRVAVSRCYRAEAGARGASTKGLYRVHEFTKVEMFAWTSPDADESGDVFEEMVDIQTEILGSLGLHCRVLEMPTADLGASAFRKIDIEAFFPSRTQQNDGWGEVTSTSICTDYQTRRLATRVRIDGKLTFPWTVNGTALAVPRVLAAILEAGWDEKDMSVAIPACLQPWMDGKEKITRKAARQ